MNILGVKIDNLSKSEILNKISEFLSSNQSHKIFTPNPEMLVDAQKDKYFREVLNSGDLNVCDGFGLSLAVRLSPSYQEGAQGELPEFASTSANSTGLRPPPLGKRRMDRYPGTDLMQDICALAEKINKSVYLLGSGDDEVVKKTAEVLQNKFPKLKISGYNKGPKLQVTSYKLQVDTEENNELISEIILTSPDILFVAFGHSKQEKWIYENLKDLPSVKIAMGVGGAFDFISGKTKRAPLFMRKIGLEWMYRLCQQPKRIGRIFKATVIFLYYALRKN